MKVAITIEGVSSLLQSNVRMVDPLDPHTIRLAELTSKRKKTHDDHRAISDTEWLGGLYWDDETGPYIPGEQLHACIRDGAKFNKGGASVSRGLVMTPNSFTCRIEYDGPRDVDSLMADHDFRLRKAVGIGQKRVIRTRPKFAPPWSVTAEAELDTGQVKLTELRRYVDDAGRLVGIGDGRRIGYGRFQAVVEEAA